ncbi:MAG: endosialidase [Pseudobutyrivibrio sp.]|nr:endosialidase [Pseudobutyrivibrio sp.]
MATITELIRSESDGSISFGDYSLSDKKKVEDFKHDGDSYKVKTFKEITKLEKNGMFVYESVPGTSVENMKVSADKVSFLVEGQEDAQITFELEPDTTYAISVAGQSSQEMKTNMSGKLSLSVELEPNVSVQVEFTRV